MPSALVDRHRWRGKIRISERADWHGYYTIASFSRVVDRSTALGTEAKRELRSFISYSNVLRCGTGNLESRTIETSLFPEHATRSLLTRETVTNRDPKRLPLDFDLKLTTGTRSGACTHDTDLGEVGGYCDA